MKVLRYTGSRYFAHIQADIETGWLHYLFQEPQAFLDNIEMFLRFLIRQVLQICYVPIGRDH
jgi:hypothetical protein